MLNFSHQTLPFTLPVEFIQFITGHVTEDGLTTINLNDTSYSPTEGGFHPVEIMINKRGEKAWVVYVTDFEYVGDGYNTELAKSNDFDFLNNVYFSLNIGRELPLTSELGEFFTLLVNNFVSYAEIGLLDKVEISHDNTHVFNS